MPDHEASRASTTGGLPVAPALGPALDQLRFPHEETGANRRLLEVSALSIVIGLGGALSAEILVRLIALITNISFYGRWSVTRVSPSDHLLGLWVVLVPIVGGLIVGVMARYGSPAVRGHGIPEAMERVLFAESRIAPRIMLLKPLSAAVSIGTGGPFGAEGPIIATGGALGSVIGQFLKITADERKTLLAAGAAAGMAAIFSAPVSAVLLAVELLLFEYRPRSIIPVALASATATAAWMVFHGPQPVFAMSNLAQPSWQALVSYLVLGAIVGVASVFVTRSVYAVEDAFERLPIHWMWWPAIGAVAVGVLGYIQPDILGVGYDNIREVLNGAIVGKALVLLVVLKFISWTVALGSGTSGGTLAPLFTIGGGLGLVLGRLVSGWAPGLGIDSRIAALVGMAAMFAGASRALLTSIVFAFETTRQPLGLMPLLLGCSAAYIISLAGMRNSIMTERLARRGAPIRTDYAVDYLTRLLVREVVAPGLVTVAANDTIEKVREWIAEGTPESQHHGYPVVDGAGTLIGVVTLRDIANPKVDPNAPVASVIRRPPAVIYEDNTLREAADHMVEEGVGRLVVVKREAPWQMLGLISRSDLLEAHRSRLAARRAGRTLDIRTTAARFGLEWGHVPAEPAARAQENGGERKG
ncbi:MAG TPA: chloride channel protein [Gemmatimonadales bacterium]|nr:chloride channel protein [Gemmatimonadales bacterium]